MSYVVSNFQEFLSHQTNVNNVDLFDLFELTPIPKPIPGARWIAGGALRRTLLNEEKINSDIDYFFSNETEFNKFKLTIEDTFSNHHKIISVNEFNTTFEVNVCIDGDETRKLKLQAIKLQYYKTPEEIINSFDFTICQFAWDGTNLICTDRALWDLARKKLVVHKITYPVASLRRLVKYTQQGFYACSGCLTEFLTECSKLQLDGQILYFD